LIVPPFRLPDENKNWMPSIATTLVWFCPIVYGELPPPELYVVCPVTEVADTTAGA
jgi:hypothetical protein